MKKLLSMAMMGLSLLAFANSMFSAEGDKKRIRITTPGGATYVVEESASGTLTVVDVLVNVTKNGVTSETSIAPQGVIGATVGGVTVSGTTATVGTLTFTPPGGATLTAAQVATSLNAAVAATGGTAPTFTAANSTTGTATVRIVTPTTPTGNGSNVNNVDPDVRNVSPSN